MDTVEREWTGKWLDRFSGNHRLAKKKIFRPRTNLIVGMTVAVVQSLSILLICAFATFSTVEAAETAIDVKPTALPRIEPGTVIENSAPKGWSHLILKSQPRVAAGDVDKVPRLVLRHSDFLFTVFVADVVSASPKGGPPFRLKRVGVGLGTDIKGQPMVVSSETHRDLGADLGLLRATVLSQSEKQLNLIVQVARTPTMIVFDAPGYYVEGDSHRPIALRYHVLVDAESGRLNTVTWLLRILADPPRYEFVEGTVRLLTPSVVEDSVLHVDADEFVVGIPKPSAFALTSLPPGTELSPIPQTLRRLTDRVRFTVNDVVTLEHLLSEMVHHHAHRVSRQ